MRALEELRIELDIATKEKELAWQQREAADRKWTTLLHTVNALQVAITHLESKEPKPTDEIVDSAIRMSLT